MIEFILLLFFIQLLSQPSIVSPLVRPPHANSFVGGVQRSPMGPPMSPNVSGGLMPHPRPQHPQHSHHSPRGPPGSTLAPRGTQAALKAEQDLKVCLLLFVCWSSLCSLMDILVELFVFFFLSLGKAAG